MIRQPYLNLYTKNVTSTASGSDTFSLTKNLDFDAIVAKLIVTSISATVPTLNIYVQGSDDGGTTYYDYLAFGTVTAAVATANALFATIPVNCGDGKYVSNITNSAVSGYVGGISGVPVLSTLFRVVWNYTGAVATSVANWTLTLNANNQSPHA